MSTEPTPRRRRTAQSELEAGMRRATAQSDNGFGANADNAPQSSYRDMDAQPAAGAPTRRKKKKLITGGMIAALVVSVVLLGGLIVASLGFSGYAASMRSESENAYQKLMRAYPLRYREEIEKSAKQYGLNPAFVSAIVLCESSFRPDAESNLGARGLMQVMENTASWIAESFPDIYPYSFDLMYDPETNLRFGCWYLKYLSDRFAGDPVKVISAYHAGAGNVEAWISNEKYSDGVSLQIDNIPMDNTKSYVRKVTKAYGIYQVYYFGDNGQTLDDSL
ncbi:MAG: transglycosylase SLT domain-containing protein [Eubacteriales bacterium]|nr:transglycosylase SLT domain-containing protein [Eubacteriales bacterium]MDD3881608.1 transglycosylase SLT domain-containing protein [Eubacteriales bacterium]MDD4512333.1 transglycosylase SLT domain-containing protein [Eubacteriales bacterium]